MKVKKDCKNLLLSHALFLCTNKILLKVMLFKVIIYNLKVVLKHF